MHVMIDLETLSRRYHGAVCQLGAVEFELAHGGPVFHETGFNRHIKLDVDRPIEPDTALYWIGESQEARERLLAGQRASSPLWTVLHDFRSWMQFRLHGELEGVWSHGEDFDLAFMADMYASQGEERPWSFRLSRDTRTFHALAKAGMLRGRVSQQRREQTMPELVKHDAFSDCIRQALELQHLLGCDLDDLR